MSRLRVALVAHHANPLWGSEPLIGWSWAEHLSQHVDLTVVTHVRNHTNIDLQPPLDVDWVFVDTESLAKTVNRANSLIWGGCTPLNRSFLEAWSLRAFDTEAARTIDEIHRRKPFDVLHRVSPISWRAPTQLGKLDIPLILGPMNGGMEMARGFPRIAKAEKNWMLRLRRAARLLDWRHSSLASADLILAARRQLRDQMPASVQHKTYVLSENGVDLGRFPSTSPRPGPGLRAIYVGRLIPCKGAGMLIEAMGQLKSYSSITLEIVGDGPDREQLEGRCRDLGVSDRVTFHGEVRPNEVAGYLEASDVLVLPSVRESGGGVILEAFASARPVIALAHGGPQELVVPGSGLLIGTESEEQVVRDLARALSGLSTNPKKRVAMSTFARDHALRHHAWSVRAQAMVDLYCEVSGRSPETSELPPSLRELSPC